uniref:Stress response protein NST1-like n=1 Tax=Elaeis guineensis var. tenera TaxID=51953 RepID=A0A8N4I7U6_ELAGV|nr:stress response protein NST1-like [Elaeis guineensis]
MEPAEEDRSGSRSMPPSAYYPEGASALADHNLARKLCQGILLPADVESLRSRQVAEMLSRFYPTMVELIFTMSELEAGYRRFGNVQAAFKEKSAAAEAERAMLVDQLQQSADREAKLIDEVSRLESELRSAKKEAKHKGRAVRRLRRERDGAAAELQGEREQLRGSLEKLAEAEEELSITQIDVEMARVEAESAKQELARAEDEARSARESADRAVEDFRSSDQYREEMLESGFASYRVGFEDGRDAVHALYPELDVSSVVPPLAEEEGVEGEGTEEMADQPSGGVIVVEEAIPEQVPTEVPLPTEAHPSAADPAPPMAETPVIPDPPLVEGID